MSNLIVTRKRGQALICHIPELDLDITISVHRIGPDTVRLRASGDKERVLFRREEVALTAPQQPEA